MSIDISALGKVAVVMGGWSAEREISLRSGSAVLAALKSSGVNAHGLDADQAIAGTLLDNQFDRAFLVLHGRGGEDGHVQGALELAGIPYTGSGVLGSALAMNKVRSKRICKSHGIRTAEWYEVSSQEEAVETAPKLGYPVIVKPVSEGSSIGVSKAMQNAVPDAFEQAFQYGDVMMERFIDGLEVTAAILGDKALPLVSMETPNLFYDYDAKYFSEQTEYQCPVNLPETVQARIRETALQAFNALGARDWGRVDFIVDRNGDDYFMELNTAPGMTDHSLVPMAARETGLSFEALCLEILSMTLRRPLELRHEVSSLEEAIC